MLHTHDNIRKPMKIQAKWKQGDIPQSDTIYEDRKCHREIFLNFRLKKKQCIE